MKGINDFHHLFALGKWYKFYNSQIESKKLVPEMLTVALCKHLRQYGVYICHCSAN